MTGTEILDLAKSLIPQGAVDTQWPARVWLMYLNRAILALWTELVDLDTGFADVLDAELTVGEDGSYTLPTDFLSLICVEDDEGEEIVDASDREERMSGTMGFHLAGRKLTLVNWEDDDPPPAISICYKKRPAGMTDVSATPEAPLDDVMAGETLASIVAVYAKSSDRALTADEAALVADHAERFATPFESRRRSA